MNSSPIPALWSLGLPLDTAPDAFGYLDSAKEWMDDPVALRERMVDDGYIYLPGFWSRESVEKTRISLLKRLHRLGFLDRNKPIDDGVPNQATDDSPLSRAMNNPVVVYKKRMLFCIFSCTNSVRQFILSAWLLKLLIVGTVEVKISLNLARRPTINSATAAMIVVNKAAKTPQ